MMMRTIKFYLGILVFLSAIMVSTVAANAKTVTYNDIPLTIETGGSTNKINSIKLLNHPDVPSDYGVSPECQQWMVADITVTNNEDYSDTIDSYEYDVWSGPNLMRADDDKNEVKKLQSQYPKLLTKQVKIKPGQSKRVTIAFIVDRNSDLTLRIEHSGGSDSYEHVVVRKIKTSNGVFAD